VSIVVALTYLNVEHVADAVGAAAGAAAALLVEGLILLGVAARGWVAGQFIAPRARTITRADRGARAAVGCPPCSETDAPL